jgi:hypothetical protein
MVAFWRQAVTSDIDVRSYYIKNWGNPDREAEFQKGECVIGVLKWQASVATEGVTLYATVGASDYPLPGVGPQHRQEYFVGLEPECDDIASSLAWLGVYAQSAQEALAPGHTYRSTHGLMAGSGFSGFLLLQPLDGQPAPLALRDGRHVEFVMTVPAFDDELDFAAKQGVERLLEVMESAEVPFWMPTRRSAFDR